MKLAHIALSPASLCLGGVLLVDKDHVVLEVTSGSPNRLVVINAPDLLRTLEVLPDLVLGRGAITVMSSCLRFLDSTRRALAAW